MFNFLALLDISFWSLITIVASYLQPGCFCLAYMYMYSGILDQLSVSAQFDTYQDSR